VGEQKHKLTKGGYDHLFIALCILLTGAGLVTLYSASYGFSMRQFKSPSHFLQRQAVFAATGAVFFIIASRIRETTLKRAIGPLVVGALALCLLVFVPGIGLSKNGARRWLNLRFITFQPSETVKIILPIYLAYIFDKKRELLDDFRHGVLPPVMVTGLFFLIIYLQNDFSTALFVLLNALVVFFIAGVKLRYFIGAVVILAPVAALLVLTKEYRLLRFMAFFDHDFDLKGAGYQVDASIRTIQAGGLWGQGWGQGTRKIASVPEIQSDFIFASFAEEAGFIGVMLFVLCFALFAWRGYRIAAAAEGVFARLLSFSLVTEIVAQAAMNIAVVSGALPATGVPLPFFSAGGSSLAVTLIACGIVSRVARDKAVNSKGTISG
jgi:cell division protein FtsW